MNGTPDKKTEPHHRTMVLRSRAIRVPILPGHYIESAAGKRISLVVSARRIVGGRGPANTLRLTLQPARKADIAPGATIHPFPAAPAPRTPKQKPEARRERHQVQTQRERQEAEHKHTLALLQDDDTKHAVPTIRTKTITDEHGGLIREPTVRVAQWRDPDDTNPNRRIAKKVSGFRVSSVLRTYHLDGKLITRKHLAAADRFLKAYELGEIGRSPTPDLAPIGSKSFTASTGPAEARVRALRDFQAAREAIGPSLFGIIQTVILNNQHAGTYAKQRGIHRNVAMGYLVAGLDRLVDHYQHDLKKMGFDQE